MCTRRKPVGGVGGGGVTERGGRGRGRDGNGGGDGGGAMADNRRLDVVTFIEK